jgi:RNA polymerase sigma-70 factor (ECF subfamily)
MNAHQMPQADDRDVLYRYARSRVGQRELAEDLVQETMLAAIQSLDRFQGRATVRTWLLSILRHKIVDHRRRSATSVLSAEADSVKTPDPVRAHYFDAKGLWKKAIASWKALEGCLERLPVALSTAFVLRELEEMETAELRRTLELSEGNLRVRLHRARLLLRECLEKNWFIETQSARRKRS